MGLLDAPAVPIRQIRVLQRDDCVPVATRANPASDSANSISSGVLGGTAKVLHVTTRTCHGLQLVYTNWRASAGPAEADGANDIYLTAAIEYPSGNVIPVRFNGSKQAVISPGGMIVSDPLGLDFAKGTSFYTRTWVGVDNGGTFPTTIAIPNSTEGHNYVAAGGADLTAAGAGSLSGLNLNTYVFAPSAILGRVNDPGKSVVALVGDSIIYGTQDNSTGYGFRALNSNYSFQKIAFPGEGLSQFIGSNGIYRYRRMSLLELCKITHVLTDYTINSLSTTTIQADAVTSWIILARYGAVYATTLTPQTTSTDSWSTSTNQTILYPSDREPRRVAFNSWLRDNAPIDASYNPQTVGTVGNGITRAGQSGHPLTGFLEIADLAETSRNSGIWNPSYTSDGTHPNSAGAAALANAIPSSSIFGSPST